MTVGRDNVGQAMPGVVVVAIAVGSHLAFLFFLVWLGNEGNLTVVSTTGLSWFCLCWKCSHMAGGGTGYKLLEISTKKHMIYSDMRNFLLAPLHLLCSLHPAPLHPCLPLLTLRLPHTGFPS